MSRKKSSRSLSHLLMSYCLHSGTSSTDFNHDFNQDLNHDSLHNGTPLILPLTEWQTVLCKQRPSVALSDDVIFSERELMFTFAICYRLSICRLSSLTLVHRTQAVEIFDNISTALGALAIRWHPLKISRISSQGNPSAGGVKHKRVAKYSDFGPIDGYLGNGAR